MFLFPFVEHLPPVEMDGSCNFILFVARVRVVWKIRKDSTNFIYLFLNCRINAVLVYVIMQLMCIYNNVYNNIRVQFILSINPTISISRLKNVSNAFFLF